MSTSLLIIDRAITSILAGQQSISWPVVNEPETSLAVRMDIPRFQFHKSFRIVDFLPADSSGVARAFLEIDSGVKAILSLTGHLVNGGRSEEHTSELQSHLNIVCRLLLEKKNIYT